MNTEAITFGTATYPALIPVQSSDPGTQLKPLQGSAPSICPSCGLINTPGTSHCDCGFQLAQLADRLQVLPQAPRPWVRYWARFLDSMIAGAALAMIANGLGIDVANWNNLVFGWIATVLWIPFEAAFVSSCGTTPGKWLLNIHLSNADRSNLTFGQALGRSIGMFVKGLGLGLPVVSFFTQLAGHSKLTKFGVTPWDRQYGVFVEHRPIRGGRILSIILTVAVFLILIGLGNSVNATGTPASPVTMVAS